MIKAHRLTRVGLPAIEFIMRVPHRIAMVWETAAAQEGLSRWFPAPVDYERHEGGLVRFGRDPLRLGSDGVVTELLPGRRLAFAWGRNEIRLSMTPIDGTTDLVFINRLGHEREEARNAAVWHAALLRLGSLLDVRWPQEDVHSLYAQYVEHGYRQGARMPEAAA
ncbi:MAG: SRPBCC domain-containing protein [Pseudoclavibacter sp.]|nr:SRPBCC domain-containing protein [Pseudoclavibacter sp.]